MFSRLKRLTRSDSIESVPRSTSIPFGRNDNIVGIWEARFHANGRNLLIEYSFLESGSGFEKISSGGNGNIIELHRYFWSMDKRILKLTYITEKMTEVQIRCDISSDICSFSDLETKSKELVLHRKSS